MVRINTEQSVEDLYEFVQKIGEGSFAQVFKAKSILTGNLRAIKKIKKSNDPETRASLMNEFDILKTLVLNISHFLGPSKRFEDV